ncbi:GTP-binding protein Era [Rhodobacter veldkampii DSM 11550]|uniref:DUF1491 domain-containing protein n=1 Tax=Phaeovulum veldkampii DSM 11550 TaxID=1185920 RepID=A0A2T4JJZ2_9RHOB|nr:DUF1491 family protein [Phaeovulum veldkampii]MBK5946913.1 GTP-binding protein Era [Phaeovulum veldkampii DSM 11550]NCU19480.1 DUF1491 family protein [Candidatus Falkowbacteria bacterium]PTE18216.1 DUF1491 domain-containing protein [Phaeovulum veldkampii DSM 11550]TDQ63483.1 hypothetical protein EV658_102158 [Phaeovulum veldkampii DSM 11550]
MATEPRLTADFWVRAYLARLGLADIPAYVTHRGDAVAGAVLVKCATLDGRARTFQRSFDLMTGNRAWVSLSEGAEPEVDALIARQRARDPDLWVVEIESRDGRTLLDEPGLSD